MLRALPRWVSAPALRPVWEAAGRRLEAGGLAPRGRFTVTGLDRDARHALSDLLGRPVLQDSRSVDLAELDTVLGPYGGVVTVVVAVTGRSLADRPRARREQEDRRTAPITAARAAAEESLPVAAWTGEWLEGLRAAGVLSRLPVTESVPVVERAVAVLGALTLPPLGTSTSTGTVRPVARNELAARHAGDAHALDDGSVLALVVLRGLAAWQGLALPGTARGRRELWERAGVVSDLVSSTCLTLGLRPVGDGPFAVRLRAAADDGAVVHLTARDLRGADLRVEPGTQVLVCENPRVLEAVADVYGGAVPVVCTSGSPALVCLDVLARLAGSGAALRYHGDFDWPGIEIANRLVAAVGVRPWLMTAADYEAATPGARLPLTGRPVEPAWDLELGAAMRAAGLAVHEEAVLPHLLAGLHSWPPAVARRSSYGE